MKEQQGQRAEALDTDPGLREASFLAQGSEYLDRLRREARAGQEGHGAIFGP